MLTMTLRRCMQRTSEPGLKKFRPADPRGSSFSAFIVGPQ